MALREGAISGSAWFISITGALVPTDPAIEYRSEPVHCALGELYYGSPGIAWQCHDLV